MLHVFDEATGTHVESALEGSDLSRWGDGYQVLSADLDDPSAWKLQDGELVPFSEADTLAAAKLKRQGELLRVINNFIEAKPEGHTRYDTNLKLNLMQATMAAMAAGETTPTPVAAVNEWIAAVQTHYFALKTEIESAASLSDLAAVDLSYATLEAAYGVAGSVLPDPDIYTEDLAQEGA